MRDRADSKVLTSVLTYFAHVSTDKDSAECAICMRHAHTIFGQAEHFSEASGRLIGKSVDHFLACTMQHPVVYKRKRARQELLRTDDTVKAL
eukprot:8836-Heterococcus_DN1.PRE.1